MLREDELMRFHESGELQNGRPNLIIRDNVSLFWNNVKRCSRSFTDHPLRTIVHLNSERRVTSPPGLYRRRQCRVTSTCETSEINIQTQLLFRNYLINSSFAPHSQHQGFNPKFPLVLRAKNIHPHHILTWDWETLRKCGKQWYKVRLQQDFFYKDLFSGNAGQESWLERLLYHRSLTFRLWNQRVGSLVALNGYCIH